MPAIPVTLERGRTDWAPAFKFWVELQGIVVARFTECSGLNIERDASTTVEEGGVNNYVHVLPGRVKYSNVTLKYGVTDSNELWEWFQKGIYDGKVERKNFSILLRNSAGDVVRRWDVIDAFPVKWQGPQLNTSSNEVAIETLEVAHHGLQLNTGGGGRGR